MYSLCIDHKEIQGKKTILYILLGANNIIIFSEYFLKQNQIFGARAEIIV